MAALMWRSLASARIPRPMRVRLNNRPMPAAIASDRPSAMRRVTVSLTPNNKT